MPESPKTEKKTRRKIPYQVEVQMKDGTWSPVNTAEIPGGEPTEYDSTMEAAKWIKGRGQDGGTYRVAHITFGPVTVKTESIPKRTLA